MSRTIHLVDIDELMRSMNPLTAEQSSTDVDLALQRLLSQLPEAPQPRPRRIRATRVRVVLGGTVAATAAFAAVNLLPASTTPGAVGNASAKQVIAHAAAAATGPSDGILDVASTVTIDGGATNETYTTESWTQQTAPYDYWANTQSSSFTGTTTVAGGDVDEYNSQTNTITESHLTVQQAQAFPLLSDPAYRAALTLEQTQNTSSAADPLTLTVPPSQGQAPATFSDVLTSLLKLPGLVVNQNASVNGQNAISISSQSGDEVLYVQASTYTPLKFVVTYLSGLTYGSDNTPITVTTTFSSYQTLPAGSVSMPDVTQLHPNATVSELNVPVIW